MPTFGARAPIQFGKLQQTRKCSRYHAERLDPRHGHDVADARAKAAGAEIVVEMKTQSYGRTFSCATRRATFGTSVITIPGPPHT